MTRMCYTLPTVLSDAVTSSLSATGRGTRLLALSCTMTNILHSLPAFLCFAVTSSLQLRVAACIVMHYETWFPPIAYSLCAMQLTAACCFLRLL